MYLKHVKELKEFNEHKDQAPSRKLLWLGTWTLSAKPAAYNEGIPHCAYISDNEQRIGSQANGW